MTIIKKILAVLAMILCVVSLVFCAVGAVGVWVARAPLTAASVGLLTRAHDTLVLADSLAGDVGGGVSDIRTFIGKVQGTIDDVNEAMGVLRQIGPIEGLLSSVTDGAAQLEGRVERIESSATRMRAQLAGWIALSEIARQRVGAWITAGAVGISLVLLWFGLGQASLFIHALAWFARVG